MRILWFDSRKFTAFDVIVIEISYLALVEGVNLSHSNATSRSVWTEIYTSSSPLCLYNFMKRSYLQPLRIHSDYSAWRFTSSGWFCWQNKFILVALCTKRSCEPDVSINLHDVLQILLLFCWHLLRCLLFLHLSHICCGRPFRTFSYI